MADVADDLDGARGGVGGTAGAGERHRQRRVAAIARTAANLASQGSLATILWLTALRREGQAIGAGPFLKLGVLVMPPALVLAIAAAVLLP